MVILTNLIVKEVLSYILHIEAHHNHKLSEEYEPTEVFSIYVFTDKLCSD